MRKILINVPSQPPGRHTGIARMCFNLLRTLVQRGGYEYALRTTFAREDLPIYLRDAALDVITISPSRHHFLNMLRENATVPALAKKIGAAVILSIDQVAPAIGDVPRAMIVHDVVHRMLPDKYGSGRINLMTDLMFKILTSTSDAIAAVSQTTRRDLERFYPAARGKTVVIPLDSTLRIEDGGPDDAPDVEQPYILTVATGVVYKNLGAIGRAMRILDDKGVSVRLVHVGNDSAEQIIGAADGPLSRVRIVRLPKVDDETLVQLYRHAACYVNASIYEGFCLPIIEAQRLGCPLICSNLSAVAEVAGNGALLCDPNDPSAIASHIERILGDEGLRKELSARGTANAKRFSWDRSAEAFEMLFDRLATNRA